MTAETYHPAGVSTYSMPRLQTFHLYEVAPNCVGGTIGTLLGEALFTFSALCYRAIFATAASRMASTGGF